MKKLFLTITILITSYCWFNYTAVTHSASAQAGRSGAPDETDCKGCHSGAPVNSGIGTLTFDFPGNFWEPDSNYVLGILIEDSLQKVFGFEITALTNSDEKAGEFSITNSINTTKKNSDGRQYVTHKNADSTNSWSFNWQAPLTVPEDTIITFYIAANAADNNGNTSGDNVYTTFLDVSIKDGAPFDSSNINGIDEISKSRIIVFPNPTTDYLHIPSKIHNLQKASIYTLEGKFIRTNVFTSSKEMNIVNVKDLDNGQYILKLFSNYRETESIRFIKSN